MEKDSLSIGAVKRSALALMLFLGIAVLLNPWLDFYEGGAYLAYLRAFLSDFDLNIINHVSDRFAWLTTRTHAHPDFHSEAQTSSLLFLYAMEWLIAKIMTPFAPHEYQLTGLALSGLSLFFGFRLCADLYAELGEKKGKYDFVLFYFGCALFYYSFFAMMVIEVTALPLIAYLLLTLVRIRKGTWQSSPWTLGITVGFLCISKFLFVPFCVFVVSVALTEAIKRKRASQCLGILLPIVLLAACEVGNRLTKYGEFMSPGPQGLAYLSNFSPAFLLKKLLLSFFYPGGIFFINPIYLVSLLGLWPLSKRLRKRKLLGLRDQLILGLCMLPTFLYGLALIGPLNDDHLCGRHNLVAFPILLLGFSSFVSTCRKLWPRAYLIVPGALSVWHFILTLFFLITMHKSSYLFPREIVPSWLMIHEVAASYWESLKNNFLWLLTHLPHLFAFSFAVAAGMCWRPLRSRLALAAGLVFLAMSAANALNHQKKVDKLTAQGFYTGKVIGNGAELYFWDYLFDGARTIRGIASEKDIAYLNQSIDRYYSVIQSQILRSTPHFDQVLKTRAPYFSIWMRAEGS